MTWLGVESRLNLGPSYASFFVVLAKLCSHKCAYRAGRGIEGIELWGPQYASIGQIMVQLTNPRRSSTESRLVGQARRSEHPCGWSLGWNHLRPIPLCVSLAEDTQDFPDPLSLK
jgi:hypothetical protein